jgi:hypothetical protein
VNYHALLDSFGAGNDRFILTFNLHKAETTRGSRLDLFLDGTEVGYVDAILEGSPEDGHSLFSLDVFTVNG